MPRISNIEVLQQVEQSVLQIETKTDMQGLSQVIGSSFMKIGTYLKELGESPTDIPYVCYQGFESMDEKNIHVIIGFPVAKPLPDIDNIKSVVIPARKVIFCMYRGEYEAMAPVYGEMMTWMKDKGYKVIDTSYEYYYNEPDSSPENLLTKIIMPLE